MNNYVMKMISLCKYNQKKYKNKVPKEVQRIDALINLGFFKTCF